MTTSYDKLLCESLCARPSNQFQAQIDQGPEEDEHLTTLTTVSIKITARLPRLARSRMVIISMEVFIPDFRLLSFYAFKVQCLT